MPLLHHIATSSIAAWKLRSSCCKFNTSFCSAWAQGSKKKKRGWAIGISMDIFSISETDFEALLLKFLSPSYFLYKEISWERFRIRSGHTCAKAGQVRKGSTTWAYTTEPLEKTAVQPLAQHYRERAVAHQLWIWTSTTIASNLLPVSSSRPITQPVSANEAFSGAVHVSKEVFLTDTRKSISSYSIQLISAIFFCTLNI